jgi:hypothetical protein
MYYNSISGTSDRRHAWWFAGKSHAVNPRQLPLSKSFLKKRVDKFTAGRESFWIGQERLPFRLCEVLEVAAFPLVIDRAVIEAQSFFVRATDWSTPGYSGGPWVNPCRSRRPRPHL